LVPQAIDDSSDVDMFLSLLMVTDDFLAGLEILELRLHGR
jgi:hypothetical protein